MNNVIKRIEIDLYSPTSYEVIKAQQGDNNSRVIEFALYDQEEPYTISNNVFIKMEGHRGDNSSFSPKDCTVADNIITVTLDSDVLYEPGIVEAKIVMYNKSDDSILSTIPFKIHVQKNPCNKNKLESEKSSVIDWLVLNFNKLKTSFEEQASDLKSHLEDNVRHITSSERTNWDDAHNKSHEHSNKSILDKITQSLLDNCNAAYTHISDTVKHITSSERTLWNTVSNKVDKIEGKGLSTNDYTTADKNIVASMSSGAVMGIKGDTESTYRTGNVNITPADIGAVSKSGDVMTGELIPGAGIEFAGKDGYIAYPDDGYLGCVAINSKGYIQIFLPISNSNTMLKFTATIYNHEEGTSVDYLIAGYSAVDNGWYRCTAVCLGKAGTPLSNLTVRFGDYSGRSAITIGETSTAYTYLGIKIHDIFLGYSGNTSFVSWKSGWIVGVTTTALTNVKATIANTHVADGYLSTALSAIDVRNSLTPTKINDIRGLRTIFSTMAAFGTQVSGRGYIDALTLNGYADATGGRINALLFSKTEPQRIYHYTGEFDGSSWTGKKEIAYRDDFDWKSQGSIEYRYEKYLMYASFIKINICTISGAITLRAQYEVDTNEIENAAYKIEPYGLGGYVQISKYGSGYKVENYLSSHSIMIYTR